MPPERLPHLTPAWQPAEYPRPSANRRTHTVSRSASGSWTYPSWLASSLGSACSCRLLDGIAGPIMLSFTSLFSSSGPVAPHAPLGPPWPLASPARLPRLPFLAPDRRLALDYVNLSALFIHLRINSHPSEPLRGSVTAADQSPGQGGKA